MKIIDTEIDGLQILEPTTFEDVRGKFVKIFNDDYFREHGLDFEIKESYYTTSEKNVIRGMHFQVPPFEHVKLVSVPAGEILDVVLDVRKNSPTYGKYYSIKLSCENAKVLIIPVGLAHGFKSLRNNTIVSYMQSSVYDSACDRGIAYNTFKFDWGDEEAIVSQRDLEFESFKKFSSPFTYKRDS